MPTPCRFSFCWYDGDEQNVIKSLVLKALKILLLVYFLGRSDQGFCLGYTKFERPLDIHKNLPTKRLEGTVYKITFIPTSIASSGTLETALIFDNSLERFTEFTESCSIHIYGLL